MMTTGAFLTEADRQRELGVIAHRPLDFTIDHEVVAERLIASGYVVERGPNSRLSLKDGDVAFCRPGTSWCEPIEFRRIWWTLGLMSKPIEWKTYHEVDVVLRRGQAIQVTWAEYIDQENLQKVVYAPQLRVGNMVYSVGRGSREHFVNVLLMPEGASLHKVSLS